MGYGYLKRKIEANKYRLFHKATTPFYSFAEVVLISMAMNFLTEIVLSEGRRLCAWQVGVVVVTISLCCAGFQLSTLVWKLRELWHVIDLKIDEEQEKWEETGRPLTRLEIKGMIESALDEMDNEARCRVWEMLAPFLIQASRAVVLGFLALLALCLIKLDAVIPFASSLIDQLPSLAPPTPALSTIPTPTVAH